MAAAIRQSPYGPGCCLKSRLSCTTVPPHTYRCERLTRAIPTTGHCRANAMRVTPAARPSYPGAGVSANRRQFFAALSASSGALSRANFRPLPSLPLSATFGPLCPAAQGPCQPRGARSRANHLPLPSCAASRATWAIRGSAFSADPATVSEPCRPVRCRRVRHRSAAPAGRAR